jgi:hypothetical protein
MYTQLSATFLIISAHPHAAWNVLGSGLRLAEDVGAHRKWKNLDKTFDAQQEMYKRAVWYVKPEDFT